jgi:hypothetical protein
MAGSLRRQRSRSSPAEGAAAALRQVFGRLASGFAFRLWDGTEVPIGGGAPAFTVVIPAPKTFARLMRDPTPYAFAEAYVESAIDIEGDLFAAMDVATALESLRLPLAERLRLGWTMRAALRSDEAAPGASR